jgi:hypothetical protein
MLAVAGDSANAIDILYQSWHDSSRGGFKLRSRLEYGIHDAMVKLAHMPRNLTVDASSQYIAWSPDGRYLVATSDNAKEVYVWLVSDFKGSQDARTFEESDSLGSDLSYVTPIARFVNHLNPCLPVSFCPSNPSILVWAERGVYVHVCDLRQVEDLSLGLRKIWVGQQEEGSAIVSLEDQAKKDAMCCVCVNVYETMKENLRCWIIQETQDRGDELRSRTDSDIDALLGKLISGEELSFAEKLDAMVLNARFVTSLPLPPASSAVRIHTLEMGHWGDLGDEHITGLSVARGIDVSTAPQYAALKDHRCVREPGHVAIHSCDTIVVTTTTRVRTYSLSCIQSLADMSNIIRQHKHTELPHWVRSFRDAMLAFLLCVKASRRHVRPGVTCLADLPQDCIFDIIKKAALPTYKWTR